MSAQIQSSPGKEGEHDEDHTISMPPIIEKVLAYDKASLDDP
jgi:hypothetical protein